MLHNLGGGWLTPATTTSTPPRQDNSPAVMRGTPGSDDPAEPKSSTPYLQLWCAAEAKVRLSVDQTMRRWWPSCLKERLVTFPDAGIVNPNIYCQQYARAGCRVFWAPNNCAVRPFLTEGRMALMGLYPLGMAHRNQSSVMLTGDLALLHDTNGFLLRNKFVGHWRLF